MRRVARTLKGKPQPWSSQRMKRLNQDAAFRQKCREGNRRRRGKSFVGQRGGRGLVTEPQRMLAEALGLAEHLEHVVKTKPVGDQFESLPNWYAVDIAHPEARVAVEVDGNSHRTKKWQFLDRRKEAVLAALGWCVLRFWNEEVLTDLSGCTEKVERCITSRLKGTTTT